MFFLLSKSAPTNDSLSVEFCSAIHYSESTSTSKVHQMSSLGMYLNTTTLAETFKTTDTNEYICHFDPLSGNAFLTIIKITSVNI